MVFDTSPATLAELVRWRARQKPEAGGLYREVGSGWQRCSWSEFASLVDQLATALLRRGLAVGDRVVIIAPSCLEWEVVEKAAMAAGLVVVGVEPYATRDRIRYIVEHSGASAFYLRDQQALDGLPPGRLSGAKFALVGDLDRSGNGAADASCWDEITRVATDPDLLERAAPTPEEPALLVYTSGTTGTPKGVVYSHRQYLLAADSIVAALPAHVNDRGICWLPMANLFQRMANVYAARVGGSVYFIDDPRRVMEVVARVRPTIMIGVPRFLEKLHQGLELEIDSMPGLPRRVVRWGVRAGDLYRRHLRNGDRPGIALGVAHAIAEAAILRRLRGVVGGQLRFMVTGAAPCPVHVLEFLDAIGIAVYEAYGLTENIVPVAMNRPGGRRLGSVGRPLEPNEVRIAEDGEVLVRGEGLFDGYVGTHRPSAFTADGFYATGDLGRMDRDGFLYLTGRRSEVVKSSTGRRVALPVVERALRGIPWVDDAVVFASGWRVPLALLTLDAEQLPDHRSDHELVTEIARQVADASAALDRHHRVGGCLLRRSPLAIERGELTPNLKVRRHVIEADLEAGLAALDRQVAEAADEAGPIVEWL